MAKNRDEFTDGYICCVANLIRMHGCDTESKDLMNGICRSKSELIQKGVSVRDIEVLDEHNLLTP